MSTLPDPEALLTAALRSRPLITTWSGTRIGTKLGATFPAVRVTLITGPSRPLANTGQPSLQWEAWADTEEAAIILAKAIDGEADRLAGTYGPGVIITSWAQGQYFHSRDEETARQRYIGQIGLITQ